MLPNQQFSENVGPRWVPKVWEVGPDALIAQAQDELFEQYNAIVHDELHTAGGAMAGPVTGQSNESEQFMNPDEAPQSRAALWRGILQDLRKYEPVSVWNRHNDDGNPPPPAP